MNQKEFGNVSIITNLKLQKDEINQLGSVRFAAETGQTLTHMFSIDSISSDEYEGDQHKNKSTACQKC